MLNTAPEFAVTHPTAIQAICRALARRKAMVLLHDEAEPAGLGKLVAFDERRSRIALELPATLGKSLVRASHMIADLDGIQIVLPLWTTQPVAAQSDPLSTPARQAQQTSAAEPGTPRGWLQWLRGPSTGASSSCASGSPRRRLHNLQPQTELEHPDTTQWLNVPAKLWRIQRREGFRLAIRDDEPLVIEPQLPPIRDARPAPGSAPMRWPDKAQVLDISVRGLAWQALGTDPTPQVGDRCNRVIIDLPDSGVVVVDLQVKRVEPAQTRAANHRPPSSGAPSQTAWRVACAFVDLPEPMERRIQHWLLQTERARRRGDRAGST